MSTRTPPRRPAALLDTAAAHRRLDAALVRRAALLAAADTNVARLVHAAADGLPGFVLERLGPLLIVQLHEERLALTEETARELCAAAAERLGATAVYQKQYPAARTSVRPDLDARHRDPRPWLGTPAPAELPVLEHGLTYLVRPYDGYLTGLFLDHRGARRWVRAEASGRRILNLFAYTCAYTVAAAAGGAAATASVDVSRKALEWGKRNLAANGMTLGPHRFYAADVFEYFRRATRQRHRFDLVLLDPPTFARNRAGRPFVLRADLDRLVAGALSLLAPGGRLLLSVNHRETPRVRLRHAVERAAGACGQRVRPLEPPPGPEDFAGDPGYATSVLFESEGGAGGRRM